MSCELESCLWGRACSCGKTRRQLSISYRQMDVVSKYVRKIMFIGISPSNLLVMFLFGIFQTIAGSKHEAGYSCYKGCHSSFKPICGADGQTYSNGCVATCQGVAIAHSGSCPGEPILHLANTYVVNGSAATNTLPSHHFNAFKHEGYRYAGQLSFSPEMPTRQHKKQDHASPGTTSQQQQGRQQILRAIRATREGHVYIADMDESVDMVLNKLLEVHANSTTSASHVASLLHSLQRFQVHGSRGAGSRHAGSGSKWTREHTLVAKEATGEHNLQPGLDMEGAASGFVAQGAVDKESRQQQQKQQQQQVSGRQRSDTYDASGRRGRDGDVESGKPRSGRDAKGSDLEQHRQARRSLGIFDIDDRIDCPRTVTYPFTAVGQINVRDSSGNYVCSGVLVGPNVVLTAAHCVFSRSAQTFFNELDFAPSRYRTLDGKIVNPFGIIPWSYVTMYQTYSSSTTPDPNTEDIAVITLSQRIGTQAGWMGVFEPCSPYAPSRYVILTAGYPSDQPAGSCKTTQCVVVQDPCTDGYLYHKCDTAAGQSGSPMYMMAMTAARKMGPYVRAVHNIEWMQEMPNGKMASYINSGVSITPDHYRSILAWIGLSFTNDSSTTPMGPALPPASSLTSHH